MEMTGTAHQGRAGKMSHFVHLVHGNGVVDIGVHAGLTGNLSSNDAAQVGGVGGRLVLECVDQVFIHQIGARFDRRQNASAAYYCGKAVK